MREQYEDKLPFSKTTVRTRPRYLTDITAATLAKDIRLEWRSKDAINAMLFFALLVVVIFSFSFDPTAEESRRIAGGSGMGGVSVCRGGGAEPNLGAGTAQSGAGCLSRFAGAA